MLDIYLKFNQMCGIVCALDLKQSSNVLRSQVLEMSKKVRHRGDRKSVV